MEIPLTPMATGFYKVLDNQFHHTLGYHANAPEANHREGDCDRRAMVRTLVDAIRVHCPNPPRAACDDIARAIVSRYPQTFADKTGEGELLGCGYYSLLTQIKTRVEHVNRNSNDNHRRRQPKCPRTSDGNDNPVVKIARTEHDSYGYTNWKTTSLPDGETADSLAEKNQKTIIPFSDVKGLRPSRILKWSHL